jgi:hypothetical protein
LPPPQQGARPRQHDLGGQSQANAVIRAGIEPTHLVDGCRIMANQQDWHLLGGIVQLL